MTNFNDDQLGYFSTSSNFLLEAEKGIAYAKATNDSTPLHLDGTYMPPVYGVVPAWVNVFETMNRIVPPEHFFSVVHGEQDMIWHKALKSGITLSSKARAESISVKDSGTTLVIKAESVDAENEELVLEQYFTFFFRGVHGGDYENNAIGELHLTDLDDPEYKADFKATVEGDSPETLIYSASTKMDLDQTYRYADASGDRMPIHIDEDFAKSVGLDGIIIHGLCTMANVSSVLIAGHCEGDPTRLARMSLRFASPLRPGDEILTSLYHSGQHLPQTISAGGKSHYFNTVRLSDNRDILTNGLAYIRV